MRKALELSKPRLALPIIYNTGGYDRVETIRGFQGLVDVYLPDFKYADPALSSRYSNAPDYFEVASRAIQEMHCQCGYPAYDDRGGIVSGVIVRHLVLPSCTADSMRILDHIAATYDVSRVTVSILRQYFPTPRCADYPELNRKLTSLEYDRVVQYARSVGITHGYIQEKSAATSAYVPDFDGRFEPANPTAF